MWYKYIFPRRVSFMGSKSFRWFNLVLLPYPKELKWVYQGNGNYRAAVPLCENRNYEIGPSEYSTESDPSFCFVGNGLPLGYRSSIEKAARVCEIHYQRTYLGLNGNLS